jgi:hypothetical protein
MLVAKGASLDARAVGPASTAPFASLDRKLLFFEASDPREPRVPADERIPVVPRQVNADRTPLMVAASGGHLAAVQTLVKLGAEVNATDDEGWTSLMFGVNSGKLDVVSALIEAGADINARTRTGATALSMAEIQARRSEGDSQRNTNLRILEVLSQLELR